MCGIFGYTGTQQAGPLIIDGLRRLEYRGYDSAGIAVCGGDGRIAAQKAAGRLERLAERTDEGRALPGGCGVGHTRWATHGAPQERNAHPHLSPDGRTALVHNGVIDNHRDIRRALERRGYVFLSETDSEAAALLVHQLYCEERAKGGSLRSGALAAVRRMMREVTGSCAFAMLFADEPDAVYAVRRGSPLIAAHCADGSGCVLASDVPAVLGLASGVIYPADGDVVRMDPQGISLYDGEGREKQAEISPLAWSRTQVCRDGYAHYMLKEINEQAQAVRDTLASCLRARDDGGMEIDMTHAGLARGELTRFSRVLITGCGSAYHAGLAARAALAELCALPCECETAGELRCCIVPPERDTLVVVVSQSGETADSLAALRLCRESGLFTLAVVNVPASSIAREADALLMTHAGPEIAVATTKAYAAQLAGLYLLMLLLAHERGAVGRERLQALLASLSGLPEAIGAAVRAGGQARETAWRIAGRRDAFFIGRGIDYAACAEGSLKLKEVSCMHSEAYPAGELKHGTISLIEPGVPVIALMTQPRLAARMRTAMAEVKSRGAYVIALAAEGLDAPEADEVLRLPPAEPLFSPCVSAPAMQLMAYYAALRRGMDADRPRNLAKSVTVE